MRDASCRINTSVGIIHLALVMTRRSVATCASVAVAMRVWRVTPSAIVVAVDLAVLDGLEPRDALADGGRIPQKLSKYA